MLSTLVSSYATVRVRRFAAIVGLAATQVACDHFGIANEIVHPTAANTPRQASLVVEDTLPVGLSPASLAGWQATRDAMMDAHVVLSLGNDQPGPELFGSIGDAKLTAEGQIAILDLSGQEVRIFDSEGRYSGRFGGIGDGPEELRRAASIEELADGRLLVTMRSRMKAFESIGGTWRVSATFDLGLPLSVANSCLTGRDRVFLSSLTPTEEHVIREVAVGEGVIARFGPGYQDPNRSTEAQLSRGLIGCLPDEAGVLFGFQLFPVVRLFNVSGSLLWTTVLEDHSVMRITERRGTSVVTFSASQPFDALRAVHAVPSGRLIILQYAHVTQDDSPNRLRTYLVDAATGRGAAIGAPIPRIVSVHKRGFLAVDPSGPRIELWQVDWQSSTSLKKG